jgi:hypothetical protein
MQDVTYSVLSLDDKTMGRGTYIICTMQDVTYTLCSDEWEHSKGVTDINNDDLKRHSLYHSSMHHVEY